MKQLSALILSAFAAASANAEFLSGNNLLSQLNSETYFNQGHSLGYIVGVADATVGVLYCPPSNVTAGQMQDMVKNYLINNPQERHKTADFLVVRVLRGAWPCPNSSRGGGV